MAPIVLEGATLGKRHQHYNQLLRDAIATTKAEPVKIDYEKTDLENLLNIDVASKNQNVEYILDVLKGEDLFYVKRAIKQSYWLINDDQFAHIIDPEYLHSQLFPQMMPKASSMLLLHIRLTLKNESQVDKFFQYFKDKDLQTALKWLPNCSLSVIEAAVEAHAMEISPDILKRLCLRSRTVLEIFSKVNNGYKEREFKAAMFLLRSDPEKYMDCLNKLNRWCIPVFGKKQTEIVMKKCPQRFIDDFEKFAYNIDLDTFARYLKKEEIESFLIKQLLNKELKRLFDSDTINIFMKYMRIEDRHDVMNKLINRSIYKDDDYSNIGERASNANTYRWYKHAPFDIAFADLKKLIRTESNPDERNAMLMILVTIASRKLTHIDSLLRYYRERHLNEPFRFKVQFVNDIIQKTHPHLYNASIWENLDVIFRSMEVYVESQNNVQTCVRSIIVYKVTHNEPVSSIIEEKFSFDSLKAFSKKMSDDQKDRIFQYLYNLLLNKLDQKTIVHNGELAEYIELLKQGLNLLNDWKKELKHYPILINKINTCIQIKEESGWSASLQTLYDTNKSWKKDIFEGSLILSPSRNVCMNALKHDPELLARHQAAVEALCRDDAARMERVLGKLRVYWPERAREWAAAHRARLRQPAGHAALLRGLCSLLPQRELLDFLKEHEPQESKINWADTDELELSLRKNIARNMHIARPQITPETVLWYAKGDYVQFTQPSLNAILYNLRPSHSREYVLQLLNGMISLQKHGIHLAFTKLTPTVMKEIFLNLWKLNKNSSIRAALLKSTHELLCREQNDVVIADIWDLMQQFIENLTSEENKTVYNTFGKIGKVHCTIKAAYCTKAYKFLNDLPRKADCKNILKKIKGVMKNIIEELDSDFVVSIIIEFINEVLLKKLFIYQFNEDMMLLVAFILNAADEDTQTQRYEKVIIPLIEKSIESWNKINDRGCYVKQNLEEVIDRLIGVSWHYTFLNNTAKPSTLLFNIVTKLENSLSARQNYVHFTKIKLAIEFLDSSHKIKTLDCNLEVEKLHSAVISNFGDSVIQLLKEDVKLYTSSVYKPFARSLRDMLYSFSVDNSVKLKYYLHFLAQKDFVPIYLLVVNLMENSFVESEKEDLKQIRDLILSHGSPEVEIYYYNKFGGNPLLDLGQ